MSNTTSSRRPPVEMSPGVLSSTQVQELFASKAITCEQYELPDIDASAFDLRLGTRAWKLTEGQRTTTRELERLKKKSDEIAPQTDDGGQFFKFEQRQIYLVELDHQLDLPKNVNGRATGKSSIGRLDVITRLLTENSTEYDVVGAGYKGLLHVLIVPQTFSIIVKPGASLNQLRLFSGPPYASVIPRTLIGAFGTPFWHVSDSSGGYRDWESIVSDYEKSSTVDPSLFDLTVDLADPNYGYIFKARGEEEDLEPIDLRKGVGSHDPKKYFKDIAIENDGEARSVVLEERSFYIMKSKERLFVPNDVAVEVVAISERIGDIRIHYAGFAHPGFGRHNNPEKKGTPLIFEVRATDMHTRLYDASLLARIQLFKMSEETKPKSSPYDNQELKLSSFFKDWTGESQ